MDIFLKNRHWRRVPFRRQPAVYEGTIKLASGLSLLFVFCVVIFPSFLSAPCARCLRV